MPLEAKKIAELRKKIWSQSNKKLALNEITKLDPKISIPVILKILETINVAPSKESQDEKTQQTIMCALKIFQGADEKLNAGIFQMKSILQALNKDTILLELENLVAGAREIEITSTTILLYQELEVWLRGLYFRTYNAAPKNDGQPLKEADGTYKTIDTEDSMFKLFTGLTKLQVSIYYLQAADCIAKRCQTYSNKTDKNSLPIEEKSDTIQEQKAPEIKMDEGEKWTTISVQIPSNDKELKTRIIGAINRAWHAPADKLVVSSDKIFSLPSPNKLVISNDEIPSLSPVLTGNELAEFLCQNKDENDEVKITMFAFALENFPLTEKQISLLKNLKETIKSQMEDYKKRPHTLLGVAIPTSLWWKVNTETANHIIADVDKCDTIQELLQTLLKYKNELTERASNELKEAVMTILLNTFELLSKPLYVLTASSDKVSKQKKIITSTL